MRIVSLTTLVLAALPALALAQDTAAGRPEAPSIVTSGMGEARTAPDRATLMIGVQSRGPSAADASAANNARQRAVIDTLVALGIPREQIGTMGYNVYPEMRHEPSTGRQSVTGYVVSNVVRVELRDIAQVSRAIDAVLKKGANQINSLNFYKQNTDEQRRQALAQAVERARADAEALARAAGGSLGELLYMTTGQDRPIPVRMGMEMAQTRAADVATPIEPGEELIRAAVTVRWRFVPGR